MNNNSKRHFIIMVHFRNPYIEVAGSERVIISQERNMRAKGVETIILFPIQKQILECQIYGWGIIHNAKLVSVTTVRGVIRYLNNINDGNICDGLIIHNFHGINLEDLEMILNGFSRIIIFVNDFSSCCTQFNLCFNDDYYCGNAAIYQEKCNECVYYDSGKQLQKKVKKMLSNNKQFMVVAPSESAANIWHTAYTSFDIRSIKVVPLQKVNEKKRLVAGDGAYLDTIRVAYVGNPQKIKGWNEWIKLVDSLHDMGKDSNYEFYHLGNCNVERKYIKHIPVSIKRDGNEAMIKALKENKINVALLFSGWPETYSYVYYECLAADVFVVTSSISGNICNQVLTNRNGIVLNPDYKSLYYFFSDYPKVADSLKKYYMSQREIPMLYADNDEYLELLSESPFNSTFSREDSMAEILSSKLAKYLYFAKHFSDLAKKKREDK
ncbi:glycosyltransferase family 1 protein [Butyrivibrio sp. VCD2006]|uniref:glycosyltransferase family 1 protein n=1 Tax=Butyrivibrio sp. VCD2006 TaxID=1280664 RepID=UPI0004160B9B|nr:glycosyltransferase family 1 protein [Butyrivibrio sp. VCD2006]